MTIQELRSKINSASNILIVLPYLVDYDAVCSTSLIAGLITKKETKNVSIASSQSVLPEYIEILQKVGVENNMILKFIDPISYVIKVGDIQDKVNVSWNRNNGDLDLVLIPDKGEVDFSKINFSRQGGTYDLVIVINTAKLEHLGQIYERNRGLFANYELISIGKTLETEFGAKPSIFPENYSSTSELIFDNYAELGGELDDNLAEITALGLIGKTDGLQRINSSKTFEILSILSSQFNVDLQKLFQKYNSKLSKSDLNIEERVLRNLKVDENKKIIYSYLSTSDFNTLNFNSENFEANNFIPKNIKGDYDYAFIAYEKGLNNTIVLIQALKSENNIQEIASKLNAFPNTYYAQAELLVNVEKTIAQTLRAISGEELAEISNLETQNLNSEQVLVQEQPQLEVNTNIAEPQIEKIEEQKVEEVQQIENISSPQMIEEPKQEISTQSPFIRASDIAIDNNAKPAKESNYFSATDRPFDKVSN